MQRDALRRAGVLLAAGVLLLAVVVLIGLLLTHVLVHGPVGHLDDAIERSLARSRTGLGNSLTFAGTQLAEPLNVEVALAVLVLLLAAVTRTVRPALFLAVSVIGESAIYFIASSTVPRDRPHVPRLGMGDPIASYPSGHAAASVCLYGALAVLAWRLTSARALQVGLTVVAVVVPPLVGFCRMYRGFHHLTDIVVGLLLGVAWLAVTTRVLLPATTRKAEHRDRPRCESDQDL